MIAPILGPDYARSATIENGLNTAELQSAQTNFDSGLIGSGLKASEMMRQLPTQLYNDTEFIFNNLLGARVADPTTGAYMGVRDTQGLIGRAQKLEVDKEFNKQHNDQLEKVKQNIQQTYSNEAERGFELYKHGVGNIPKERQDLIGTATQDAVNGILGNNDDEIKQKLIDPNGKYKLSDKEASQALIGRNQALEQKDRQSAELVKTVQTQKNYAIEDVNNARFARMTGNPNYTYEDGVNYYDRLLIEAAGIDSSQFAAEIQKNGGIEGTNGLRQLKKIMPEIDAKKLEREVLLIDKIRVEAANARNGILSPEYARGEIYRVSQTMQSRGMPKAQADFLAMQAAGVSEKDAVTAYQAYSKDADARRLYVNQSFTDVLDDKGNVIGYKNNWASKTTSSSSSNRVIGPGSGTAKTTGATQEDGRKHNVIYWGKEGYQGMYSINQFKNGKFEYETDEYENSLAQVAQNGLRMIDEEEKEAIAQGASPEEIAALDLDRRRAVMYDTINQYPNKIKETVNQDQFNTSAIQSVTKNGTTKYYTIDPSTGEKIEFEHEIRDDGNGNKVDWLVHEKTGFETPLYFVGEEEASTAGETHTTVKGASGDIKVSDYTKKQVSEHGKDYKGINYIADPKKDIRQSSTDYWFVGQSGAVKKGIFWQMYDNQEGQIVEKGDKTYFVPKKLTINNLGRWAHENVVPNFASIKYDDYIKAIELGLKYFKLKWEDLPQLEMAFGAGDVFAKDQIEQGKIKQKLLTKVWEDRGGKNLTEKEKQQFGKLVIGTEEFSKNGQEQKENAIFEGTVKLMDEYSLDSKRKEGKYKVPKSEVEVPIEESDLVYGMALTLGFFRQASGTVKIVEPIIEAVRTNSDIEDIKDAINDIFDDKDNYIKVNGKYVRNDGLATALLKMIDILDDDNKLNQYHRNIYLAIQGIADETNNEYMIAEIKKATNPSLWQQAIDFVTK